jgi:CMP-N,N'-diacetyllegionaminic acid synthase
MKILGIIPARAGSKRIPGKNIKLLGGKPLISHIIEAALGSKLLDRILVSSDSEKILTLLKEYNKGVLPLKRPEELATDLSPAIEYVKHALSYLQKEQNEFFDIIVILQPSSPLTLAEDIDSTIQKLIDSKADSAVSVMELSHMINPLKLKRLDGDRLIPYLEEEKGRMAAEEVPRVYVRNCAVYASTVNVIGQNKIIGDDCRAYIMPPERSVDINEPIDFEFTEFLYRKTRNIPS